METSRIATVSTLHSTASGCRIAPAASRSSSKPISKMTILLVSICAKFYMYCYNRGVGKKIRCV